MKSAIPKGYLLQLSTDHQFFYEIITLGCFRNYIAPNNILFAKRLHIAKQEKCTRIILAGPTYRPRRLETIFLSLDQISEERLWGKNY